MIELQKYENLYCYILRDVIFTIIGRLRDYENTIQKILYNRLVRSRLCKQVMCRTDIKLVYDGRYFSCDKCELETFFSPHSIGYFIKLAKYEIPVRPTEVNLDVVYEVFSKLKVKSPSYGKYSFDPNDIGLIEARIAHYDTSAPLTSHFRYGMGEWDVEVNINSSLGYGGYSGYLEVSMCRGTRMRTLTGTGYSPKRCVFGECKSNDSIYWSMKIHGSKKGITVREIDREAFLRFMKAISWASLIYVKMTMDNVADAMWEVLDEIRKDKTLKYRIPLYFLYP